MKSFKPAHLVKISRNGERFWVIVEREHEVPGKYQGYVNNDLVRAPYKFGESIDFDASEVIEVLNGSK